MTGETPKPERGDVIEYLYVGNYGCLSNTELFLSPLHALIGPNDSGKSTVLRLLSHWCERLDPHTRYHSPIVGVTGGFLGISTSLAKSTLMSSDSLGAQQGWLRDNKERLDWADWRKFAANSGENPQPVIVHLPSLQSLTMRLRPEALRAPARSIPSTNPLRFQDQHGLGLAAIYDGILSRDVTAWLQINADVVRLFPTIQSLVLQTTPNIEKELSARLKSGVVVGPQEMSEGLLYYLAYRCLAHIDPVNLLLIEEPENGLHPARIQEVMRILREISKTTQVLLTTHSPLVINEMQPEEVTVLTRGDGGTVATPLTETHNFKARSELYVPGELWLNYADGDREEALIHGVKK